MTPPVILFPDRRLPLMTLLGATEEPTPVGEVEEATTVNGLAVILKMPWKRKWRVRLSNSGPFRFSYGLSDIEPGERLTYWMVDRWTVTLAPGQVSATLLRDAVPDSVAAIDPDTEEPIDVNVNGRLVTLFGRDGWTTVSYRPVLHCLVRDFRPNGVEVTGNSQGWSLEFVEEYPPL